MMASLASSLRRSLGKGRLVLVLFGIFVASQATILWILSPLGFETVMQMQTAMSADEFQSVTQSWASDGLLHLYWLHFVFDLAHPVWYSLLFASCIAFCLNALGSSSRYDFLIFVPLVAGLCDVVENALHILFLIDADSINDPLVMTSGSITHAKFNLFRVSLLLSLVLMAWVGATRLRRRLA